jgi:integrase
MKPSTIIFPTNQLAVLDKVSLERNPVAVFLSGQAPSSRYTYELDLISISSLLGFPDPFSCPWASLRFQHTAAIRTKLMEQVSSRTGKRLSFVTVNRKLSALRGVLKTAWRLGLLKAEDYYRAVDIESVKGETLPAGRELTDNEITSLMDVCGNDLSSVGARDGAIVAVMFSCGLRRAEIVNLDLKDFDPSTGKLKVSGKRRKERTAYLADGALQALNDWIRVRGSWEGPLLLPSSNTFGKTSFDFARRRMKTQSIYNVLVKRSKQAGVEKFSPHDLRRTFVSRLLEAGVDISTVSKMCGHANITTTARYDRRGEIEKQEAAKLLHVKYKRRKIR